MKKFILGVLLGCMPLFLYAQEKTILGKLSDGESGFAISGATIFYQQQYTTSDKDGTFKLFHRDGQSQKIVITHIGYELHESLVDLDMKGDIQIALNTSVRLLEEVLISSDTRPYTSQQRLDQQTIMRNNPKNVGDIFGDQAGFGIIKRGGYAMDPVFRSFKYEQLNLIYDGGLYISNACPNRMDPASTQVSPAEIDRIELVKGPYSVRYGQTMGGLINIITSRPEPVDRFQVKGELEGGYEVNGNGITGRGAIELIDKKYDISLQGGLINFDDYKNGNGESVPSSFRTYNYAAKMGWNPSPNNRFQLNLRQSFGKDIKHASLPMDSPKDNSTAISLDYGTRKTEGLLAEINLKGYYTYVDHLMTNENRPNFKMVEASSPVESNTFGGRVEFGLNTSEKSILHVGVDLRSVAKDGVRNRKVKMMNGNPIDPPREFTDLIWQDSWMMDAGAFAEANFTISERWSILAGGRLDHITTGARNVADDFLELYGDVDPDPELNFSLTSSINYHYGENGLVQLALGRGQRAAELTERYINHFNVGMDAYEYVGDPNLKSEVNNQVDLTVRNAHRKLTWSTNVFYSLMRNYISAVVDESLPRKYMPGVEPQYAKRFVNIDETWQAGFDANLNYQFTESLSSRIGAFYTYAQNVTFNEPLAEIPPFTGLISVKYEKQKFWSELAGRLVADQERVADSFDESTTPGFTVFDLLAGYSPAKSIELSFALKNMFDIFYYEHLSRPYKNQAETGMFSEPGRSFRIGAKFRF